mmetsp:Transcript_23547/g.73293  ORF Transcript_23547/g.73293 Transcript_23547/m.73293 type:complete len:208 (+) Transcript_23547:725-1348(+)
MVRSSRGGERRTRHIQSISAGGHGNCGTSYSRAGRTARAPARTCSPLRTTGRRTSPSGLCTCSPASLWASSCPASCARSLYASSPRASRTSGRRRRRTPPLPRKRASPRSTSAWPPTSWTCPRPSSASCGPRWSGKGESPHSRACPRARRGRSLLACTRTGRCTGHPGTGYPTTSTCTRARPRGPHLPPCSNTAHGNTERTAPTTPR